MQSLDPELQQDLIRVHACSSAIPAERRLNSEILERYDQLVQMHCELCRTLQTDSKNFEWSALLQPLGANLRTSHIMEQSSTPFDQLAQRQPTTAQDALDLVERTMQSVLEYYMPYYYKTQEIWACVQQQKVRYIAQRAYGRRFRV